MKQEAVCFTGHRQIPAAEQASLAQRLRETLIDLIQNGYSYFYAGGALGFDTLASQTVLALRKEYPQIKLFLALPYPAQSKGWSAEDKATYEEIKAQADAIHYIAEHYFRGCMQLRNRYLVDHSILCLCYLHKSTGGTAYTVQYAKQQQQKIINLA